ncbi:MAG: DNA-directed RNA polymerase subunit alpha [Chloroflexi bacterium]|nr:DNA-directed RNA polymerase subunit alpha [Chloroflexota bacterium]
MLYQVLPKIQAQASTQNYGRFAIGPMSRGFGTTVGVALRRILLSSLSGAAITSVRVSDVPHEFQPIPGAKEDMTMLLLNLKQVRLISHSEEPVRMHVSARGKSVITAGDIEAPADVDIINPELQILTLDTLDSDLDLEFVVEQGKGYVPSDQHGEMPIGQIPVDAIFSPIVKAAYRVEMARIEQITNYDLLIMEVWSDGTVRPADALTKAARILVQHVEPVAAFSDVEVEDLDEDTGRSGIAGELYSVPIEELDLAVRAYNCLKRASINTVGDVLERMARGTDEMLAIRNFGQKSLVELVARLKESHYLPEDYEVE